MELLIQIILLIIGFVLLIKGADVFVDGKINVNLSLPEGYTYECVPADLEVVSINVK